MLQRPSKRFLLQLLLLYLHQHLLLLQKHFEFQLHQLVRNKQIVIGVAVAIALSIFVYQDQEALSQGIKTMQINSNSIRNTQFQVLATQSYLSLAKSQYYQTVTKRQSASICKKVVGFLFGGRAIHWYKILGHSINCICCSEWYTFTLV